MTSLQLPRKRINLPSYPPERRQGYVDPREYDIPPVKPPHPFGKSGCICRESKCYCCEPDRNIRPQTAAFAVRSPESPQQGIRNVQVEYSPRGRRYSFPRVSSPRRLEEPASSSLPERFYATLKATIGDDQGPISPSLSDAFYEKATPPFPLPLISWPFLRSCSGDRPDTNKAEIEEEEAREGSVLGPLGALVTEINSTPDHNVEMVSAFPYSQLGDEFMRQGVREVWVEWIRRREGASSMIKKRAVIGWREMIVNIDGEGVGGKWERGKVKSCA